MAIIQVMCSLVLFGVVVSTQSETHSLYYIYTALSKPVNLPGIYDFTAMGLLNDRQIDYYNSKEQKKIPKQQWMEENMQKDYWDKGTQSRKSKEQWFNVNVNILIERMNDSKSDVHVLQWRHGCEIEKQENEVTFTKGIDEYSYDGNDFLSFDDLTSQWVAPNDAALLTKRKWDNVHILNQYTKGYLEKECVEWLNKFREYGDKELRNHSPPDVRVSAKCNDRTKSLTLTCLATGFYPKDVTLEIRKYRRPLSKNMIVSSGVRPNHDGTYQLRKSVELPQNEKADYDCFVTHSTLTESIIKKWDGTYIECSESNNLPTVICIVVVILLIIILAVIGFILFKKRNLGSQRNGNVDVENKIAIDLTDPIDVNGGTNNPTASERNPLMKSDGTEDETGSDSGKGSTDSSSDSSGSQEKVNDNQ